MPYTNIPPSMQGKMERCVKKVMSTGKGKQAAIAICYTSIMGKEAQEAQARVHYKAITDAPNLRGDDAQKCEYCRFYVPLPADDAETMSGEPVDTPERGICTAYEFETSEDFVCDGFEAAPAENPMPAIAAMEKKPAPFAVFKQANGAYRWVVISSNSYQDRDREIVSQKALEADVARMDATGQYGPLRWWHIGKPDIATRSAGPGLDIGTCDFAALHGRMLIESGTFRDAAMAEKMAQQASSLQVSRAFFHPPNEPDADGIYHSIEGFERSLLPAGKAANSLTSFTVAKEADMATFREKIESFLKLGGDKDTAERIMQEAEALEATAKAAGVAAKETETPVTAKEDPPAPVVEPPSPEAIAQQAAALVLAQLTPILDGLKAQGVTAETATKEAKDASAALAAQLAQVVTAQVAITQRLDTLDALQPRGFRASRDDSTITDKAGKGPGPDEKKNEFLSFVLGQ